MNDDSPEVADLSPPPEMPTVALYGGPFDGGEVGVSDPLAPLVLVMDPGQLDRRAWVTHHYELRHGRHEFVRTVVITFGGP